MSCESRWTVGGKALEPQPAPGGAHVRDGLGAGRGLPPCSSRCSAGPSDATSASTANARVTCDWAAAAAGQGVATNQPGSWLLSICTSSLGHGTPSSKCQANGRTAQTRSCSRVLTGLGSPCRAPLGVHVTALSALTRATSAAASTASAAVHGQLCQPGHPTMPQRRGRPPDLSPACTPAAAVWCKGMEDG